VEIVDCFRSPKRHQKFDRIYILSPYSLISKNPPQSPKTDPTRVGLSRSPVGEQRAKHSRAHAESIADRSCCLRSSKFPQQIQRPWHSPSRDRHGNEKRQQATQNPKHDRHTASGSTRRCPVVTKAAPARAPARPRTIALMITAARNREPNVHRQTEPQITAKQQQRQLGGRRTNGTRSYQVR